MKTKEEILDERHWAVTDYKQRIDKNDWRELLLNDDDKIIFHGKLIQLNGKNLGFGVIEVSK